MNIFDIAESIEIYTLYYNAREKMDLYNYIIESEKLRDMILYNQLWLCVIKYNIIK